MAIRFDATTDTVYLTTTLPDPATTGLTVLGWWRVRADTGSFQDYYRIATGGGATINTVSTFATTLGVVVFTQSGDLDSGYVNDIDEWVAIAVTDNGAGTSLYVQPQGASTIVTSGVVGSGVPGQFAIGGRSFADPEEWLNGNAAHVRVYGAALSQAEVEAEWASATPVRSSGLWADYPFLDDIQDASGNGRHLTPVSGTPAFEPGPLEPPAEEGPAPVWSRVRVENPRIVRGRNRSVGGRLTRAGRRPSS